MDGLYIKKKKKKFPPTGAPPLKQHGFMKSNLISLWDTDEVFEFNLTQLSPLRA